MPARERTKAAAAATAAAGAPQMHQRWWSPRALLSPSHSVAVAPLSPQAAAPSQQLRRSHSPHGLRVFQLTLVLALGAVCGRSALYARSSVHDSAIQSRQQRQWYPDAEQQQDGVGSASDAAVDWSEYECVAWREASSTCTTSDRSASERLQNRDCDESISLKQHSSGGFCELRLKRTGESKQVLMTESPCNNTIEIQDHAGKDGHVQSFKCADFQLYLTFAQQAAESKFDADFSYGKCRQQLIDDQVSVNRIRYASAHKIQFQKGITLVHQSSSDLTSVYESIQRLRSTGCTLPVEFWYNPPTESEIESQDNQVFLRKMAKTLGVYLRTMKRDDDDGVSAFEGPFVKAYAAFYSAFDKVLVLDGLDNLVAMMARGDNPAHLFTAKEFVSTGATFWQDKRHTESKRTSSFVQTLFGLQSIAGTTLFPHDTGRLLIDRRRNFKALNALMYYIKNHNRIDSLQVVNSEKDVYQIAWATTSSAFHVMKTTSSALEDPESEINQTFRRAGVPRETTYPRATKQTEELQASEPAETKEEQEANQSKTQDTENAAWNL